MNVWERNQQQTEAELLLRCGCISWALAPPSGQCYSVVFCVVFVFTGVALMPSVVYLCITLFTELFNLAGSDVAVLVAVPTLEQRQASADPTLPGSCTMKRNTFNGGDCRETTVLSSAPPTTVGFHYWMSHSCDCLTHTLQLHSGRKSDCDSLSSRRSVMSNSSEGKILLNILKSLPKRGIWMIRQEGAWEGWREGSRMSVSSSSTHMIIFLPANATHGYQNSYRKETNDSDIIGK